MASPALCCGLVRSSVSYSFYYLKLGAVTCVRVSVNFLFPVSRLPLISDPQGAGYDLAPQRTGAGVLQAVSKGLS